jgi:alkanesulfonate monooxygenase SsuD/methylene tetrahydromethanopterin reductase-like flavin-dependent oxidoreductase (luciferase family)
VELGVGVGWLREEFDVLGMPFDDRGARARDHIAVMRTLWTDDVSAYQGEHYTLPECRFYPKPVQQPHPPLHVGGKSDAALRRAADLGQGWFGFNRLPGRPRWVPTVARWRTGLGYSHAARHRYGTRPASRFH